MIVRLIFGAAVVATMLIAMKSASTPKLKMALVLAGTFIATVMGRDAFGRDAFGRDAFGRDAATLLNPISDALAGMLILGITLKGGCKWLGASVFFIYVVMESWHVAAFSQDTASTYGYRLGLNVMFAVQLLLVSGSGAVQWVRHWGGLDRMGRSDLGWLPPRSHTVPDKAP